MQTLSGETTDWYSCKAAEGGCPEVENTEHALTQKPWGVLLQHVAKLAVESYWESQEFSAREPSFGHLIV